jgi:hypothetical protein
MTDVSSIRLTQFAKRAGCAAKQPPDYLLSLLAGLPPITDPNVLVGHATSDDAAVYRLSDDLALILTTDFFTPVVDRPYDFGAVAAANARRYLGRSCGALLRRLKRQVLRLSVGTQFRPTSRFSVWQLWGVPGLGRSSRIQARVRATSWS